MTTYTGVADANGDFIVPFSSAYTSGEKITVTAEKDGAIKSIELYAPSEAVGGGVIQFSGTLVDFPNNIGGITISQIAGSIGSYAFYCYAAGSNIYSKATSLVIPEGVTSVLDFSFFGWISANSLILPASLKMIGNNAFSGWAKTTSLVIPEGVTSIGNSAFSNWSTCLEIVCLALIPPTIQSNTFANLKSTCIFKVPAASVAAYQAAPNWSAFAARIQAI